MKKQILFLLLCSSLIFAQNDNWKHFKCLENIYSMGENDNYIYCGGPQ